MLTPDHLLNNDKLLHDDPAPDDLRELDLPAHVHHAHHPHHAHQESRRPTQRILARARGLSLGMTNAIHKRLEGKGSLTVRRLSTQAKYEMRKGR